MPTSPQDAEHLSLAYVPWREWVDARIVAIEREMALNCKTVDTRFIAEDKALEARLQGTAKALELAAQVQDAKWSNSNEWRATVGDQMNFLREVLSQAVKQGQLETLQQRVGMGVTMPQHDALAKDVDELNSWKDKQEGKASQTSVIYAYVLGFIGLAVGILSLVEKYVSKP